MSVLQLNKNFNYMKHIPNTITALGLLCGFLSILSTLTGDITIAAYLVFIAAIFDFFDGFAARLLNAWSELGKQLDSLSDLISFGLAPSLILFHEIADTYRFTLTNIDLSYLTPGQVLTLLSPTLVVIASAFRLAKFNIDTKQDIQFIGLPTPASGLFFASLPLVRNSGISEFVDKLLNQPLVLTGITMVLAYLLVSKFPMFSMKIEHLKDKNNIPVYTLITISLILLILFSLKAVFVIIILYIFMSLVIFTLPKKNIES